MAVAFTGHRPHKLCGYKTESYNKFVKQLEDIIGLCVKEGHNIFITGGAQGFDQLAFWAVNRAKKTYPDIKNVVYLPYKNFGSIWADKGLFSKEQLELIKKHADNVVYVKETELYDKQTIVNALMNRNEAMLDNASTVIALTNENIDTTTEKGGTIAAIKSAIKRNHTVVQLKFKNQNELLIESAETIWPKK